MRTCHTCLWTALALGLGVLPAPVRADRAAGRRLIGFEVDLARLLARSLGAEPRFVQGDWDKLPNMLDRGDVDLVLNGYEWTAERAATMDATVPYYIYELQLLARSDDPSIRHWESLRARAGSKRKRVGVLGGSAAEKYLQTDWADDVEIVAYDGTTNALREVETGKIDASVQDTPAVAFYRSQFPRLHAVDPPRKPGYYVIYVRQGDGGLQAALDQAIRAALKDGDLRRIDQTYAIWNPTQARLPRVIAEWPARAERSSARSTTLERIRRSGVLRWGGDAQGGGPYIYEVEAGATASAWAGYARKLLAAAAMTVRLSVVAMPLAIALGLLIAIGRLYGPTLLRTALGASVEVLRGTPLLLQLMVIYYGLSEVGVNLPAFWAAILGLAINYSAYEAEIYRAGFQAIPPGQMEAALALGLSRGQAIRRIVAPQAVRIAIPGVTNDFIAMFKDSSLASVITVEELSKRYQIEVSNHPHAALTLGLMTAALYLLMSYPLSLFAGWIERRLGKERPR